MPTRFKYDDFNRIILQEDADGNAYKTEYDDYYPSSIGQSFVLRKISTDPLGIITVETHDVLDQLSSVKKLNTSDSTLSLEEFEYDQRLNLTKQKSHVFADGKQVRYVEREQEYDCMNRLTKMVEAANTDEKKTTRYTYTSRGQLEVLTKPNGVELCRTYDLLGNEKTLISSDFSISYEYEYNKLGGLELSLCTGQKIIPHQSPFSNTGH